MRTKTLAQPHKAAPSTPAQDKAPKAKPKTITVVKKPQSLNPQCRGCSSSGVIAPATPSHSPSEAPPVPPVVRVGHARV